MAIKRMALMVNNGRFEVRAMSEFGEQETISESPDLQDCLTQAYIRLGHPLVIPISGPNTEL